MAVKFSIIVPIYNAEKYLKECVDSVLLQTFNNYEIVLVNDGSTDNSYEICVEYEKNFKEKIHIYTKKNEGLSATRNFGLSVCSGDYIIFLDSDDFIEPNSLEVFNDIICKKNVEVIAGYASHYTEMGGKENSRPYLREAEDIKRGTDFFQYSLYQNNMRVCAPYYITKRSLIEDNNLRFKIGLLQEDELWTPILLYYAKAVLDLKFCFYNYRITNNQSITRSPSNKKKRAMDRIIVAEELDKFFSSKANDNSCKCFQDNIAAQYMYAVYDGRLYKDKNLSIDRRFPMRHAKTNRYKFKAFIFALSPQFACWLRKYK